MSAAAERPVVFVTDYAWPDTEIERKVIEGAGFKLVAGPATPSSAAEIEALVQKHQPVGILTNWAPVTAKAIASSPGLRIVARLGVGLDNIAVEEATKRGIWVTNVPDYCFEEVSDHSVGMLLAFTRGLVHFDREVQAGRWEPATAKLKRMRTLTCGIVGFGRIGRSTAQKLAGFGTRVLAYTRSPTPEPGVEFVSLEDLLKRSDAVIVHIPLTAESKHLINRERLALMRPGAFLINVSRGAVIDTEALIEALESGHLGGAALDVLENEPNVPPALLGKPNVILTPHTAFTSDASLTELRQWASEDVVRVLRGEPAKQPRNTPA
ncbi:MAG TPA: C-terminal binding protein, partial [Steroidobacteraceae bacterium]|nr:C-terminal binding protein [Steroidobacteraceae bacterium]